MTNITVNGTIDVSASTLNGTQTSYCSDPCDQKGGGHAGPGGVFDKYLQYCGFAFTDKIPLPAYGNVDSFTLGSVGINCLRGTHSYGGGRIRIQSPTMRFEAGSVLNANGEDKLGSDASGGGSGGTIQLLGGHILVSTLYLLTYGNLPAFFLQREMRRLVSLEETLNILRYRVVLGVEFTSLTQLIILLQILAISIIKIVTPACPTTIAKRQAMAHLLFDLVWSFTTK